jgi:hypothetical protein
MSDCLRFEGLLAGYLDGEVTPADRHAVERHLQTCIACRADLRAQATTRTLLRTNVATASAAPDWAPRTYRLGQASIPTRVTSFVGALAAAALLLLLIFRPHRIEATGVIGDSNCGLKHHDTYSGDHRGCTLNCVRHGAEFILLADGQIYRIANQSFANLAAFAAARVTVRGTFDGGKITLSQVVPAEGTRELAHVEPPLSHGHLSPTAIVVAY